MGVIKFFSSDRFKEISRGAIHFSKDSLSSPQIVKEGLPNPKPDRYEILSSLEIGKYLIIKIKYLDCINYEGVKILVFKDITLKQLKKQKLIDPHFSENKNFKSPIARFEPTKEGWSNAKLFVKSIKK